MNIQEFMYLDDKIDKSKVLDITSGDNNLNNDLKLSYDIDFSKRLSKFVLGDLPYPFQYGSAVVYNNEIHILGGEGGATKHYRWNDISWISVSSLPYSFYRGEAVVYNNEIHLLGGTNNGISHYKWNGTSWTRVSTLPYSFHDGGSAVVYNNEIHLLGGTDYVTYHYKWDGTSWTSVSTIPYQFRWGDAVVCNNKIHILGTDYTTGKNYHYEWNGTSWTSSTNIYNFNNSSAVVYNDEIHLLGSYESSYRRFHQKIIASGSRQTVSTLPYDFCYGTAAVVYNNEIHIFGGAINPRTQHYKFSTGTSWSLVTTVNTDNIDVSKKLEINYISMSNISTTINLSKIIAYDDKIHIFGTNSGSNTTKWYVIDHDNVLFTKETNLPYAHSGGSAVIYNDEIHLLGCSNSSSNYTKHYKCIGNQWVSVSTLPTNIIGMYNAVTYNNEIHIIFGVGHYKWDGSSTIWQSVSTPPTNIRSSVVYNNEIHAFGNGDGSHYKWDGTSWTSVSTTPITNDAFPVVVCNNRMYLLYGYACYEWTGEEWVLRTSNIGSSISINTAITAYDNKIDIITGTVRYNIAVGLFYPTELIDIEKDCKLKLELKN